MLSFVTWYNLRRWFSPCVGFVHSIVFCNSHSYFNKSVGIHAHLALASLTFAQSLECSVHSDLLHFFQINLVEWSLFFNLLSFSIHSSSSYLDLNRVTSVHWQHFHLSFFKNFSCSIFAQFQFCVIFFSFLFFFFFVVIMFMVKKSPKNKKWTFLQIRRFQILN